jgi:hypothetical protein
MKLKVFTVRIPEKDLKELHRLYLLRIPLADVNISANKLVNIAVKVASDHLNAPYK